MAEKIERSSEIIRLWNTEAFTQQELAASYALSQSRISAIIYRKRPPYRYCLYCNARIAGYPTSAICPQHKGMKSARRRFLTLLRTRLHKKHQHEVMRANNDARELTRNIRNACRAEARDRRGSNLRPEVYATL